MRTLILAAASVLAIASAMPAAAGDLCDKAPEIKAAFEPRIEYERERAQRVAGADDAWTTEIRREFDQISGDGLGCRAIYDRYSAFVDDVIARIDHLVDSSSKTRGAIFRKW